jgi:HAMP domain-containing protein
LHNKLYRIEPNKNHLGGVAVQEDRVKVRFGILHRLALACAADRSALNVPALTVLTVFVAAGLLARSLAASVQELTATAEQISRGALATKTAATKQGDEIGVLARSIERLSTSTAAAIGRLRGHRAGATMQRAVC